VARKTPLTSLKRISEINLTPLMDLTFILLITFIITFPLIEQGIPINLPHGKAKELSPDRARTITVDKQGIVFLDDRQLTIAQLGERMTQLASANPDVMVLVRADEDIDYGVVVTVLRVLNDASITRLALVTQGEGEAAR